MTSKDRGNKTFASLSALKQSLAVVPNPSQPDSTLVYSLPTTQTGGWLATDSQPQKLKWDNQPEQHATTLASVLADLATAEAQVAVLESAGSAVQKQHVGNIVGITQTANQTWEPWSASSGDVSAYQTAIPELGIANDFSSITPIRNGLFSINATTSTTGVNMAFRISESPTRGVYWDDGNNISAFVGSVGVKSGITYTFEHYKGTTGGSDTWTIISVGFLSAEAG